jgi:hypothetical protein
VVADQAEVEQRQVLRWEDPDRREEPVLAQHAAIVAELRARPGQWAVIWEGRFNRSPVNAIRTAVKKGVAPFVDPAGEGYFQCTQRTLKPGENEGALYVRYVIGTQPGARK